MSLIATCPQCGKKYKLGDDKAGKKIRCSACQAVITFPSAEGDEWDAPPGEEYDAPPPPPRTPSRGGAGRSGPSSARRAQKSGMPPALKITLIILGVISGVVALGCGGCYLATAFVFKKAGEAITEAAKNPTASENLDAAGNPIPLFDLATSDVQQVTTLLKIQTFLKENKGKTVEVRGVCHSIRGKPGERSVVFATQTSRGDISAVPLPPFLLKEQTAPFAKFFPKQKITLRGKCSGTETDAGPYSMTEGTVLKVDGPPPVVVTEKDVARFRSELTKEEFQKKVDIEYCIFSGRIKKIETGNKPDGTVSRYDFIFEPAADTQITATTSYLPDPAVELAELKAGADVTVYGSLREHERVGVYFIVQQFAEAKSGN